MNTKTAKYDLVKPESVQAFSLQLQKFVSDNNLITRISGKKYVNVEGWQYAGLNFGIFSKMLETSKMSDDKQKVCIYYRETTGTYQGKKTTKDVPYIHVLLNEGEPFPPVDEKIHKRSLIKTYFAYKAQVQLFTAKGVEVGVAEAICSNLELKKLTFEEYAVNSMAQTRAQGKAYRQLLGFVFQLIGFEGTPAEEMDEMKDQQPTPKKKPEPSKPVPTPGQWGKILEKYKTGETERDQIEEHFQLTDLMKEELNKLS